MARKSARELVAEAKSRIENLDNDQLEAEMADGAVVVDIREANEREMTGAIPGAIHVPRGLLEFIADPESPMHREELDPDSRIVLHCASGGRSALAAAALQDMGFTNVAHLDPGFNGWSAEGKPVEEVTPPWRQS